MNTILFKKLRDFCLYSDIESLKKYIDDGVDINYIDSYSGSNLLKASLCGSNLEVTKLLLDNGINPNLVLLQSSILSEVENLIFEIESGIANDYDEPNIEETELLIRYGININSIDNFGNTPLDIALKDKHTKAVKLLKSLGAKTSEDLECN